MNPVQTFWQDFVRLLPQLTEGEDPSASAMDALLNALQGIDERLYFFIGSTDAGMDLILSAEGYSDLMPLLNQIKASSPVVPGWQTVITYEADLLFGQRNLRVFPETENGDVLYKMGRKGDALWLSRPVNFSVVLPDMQAAKQFATQLKQDGYRCEVSSYDGAKDMQAQAEITLELIPGIENIDNAEKMLAALALPFGGRNDGWGCGEVSAADKPV